MGEETAVAQPTQAQTTPMVAAGGEMSGAPAPAPTPQPAAIQSAPAPQPTQQPAPAPKRGGFAAKVLGALADVMSGEHVGDAKTTPQGDPAGQVSRGDQAKRVMFGDAQRQRAQADTLAQQNIIKGKMDISDRLMNAADHRLKLDQSIMGVEQTRAQLQSNPSNHKIGEFAPGEMDHYLAGMSPEQHQDFANKFMTNQIELIPTYKKNPDGSGYTVTGTEVWQVPLSWQSQKNTEPVQLPQQRVVKGADGKPQIETSWVTIPPGQITNEDLSKINTAGVAGELGNQEKEAKIAEEKANTAKALADAGQLTDDKAQSILANPNADPALKAKAQTFLDEKTNRQVGAENRKADHARTAVEQKQNDKDEHTRVYALDSTGQVILSDKKAHPEGEEMSLGDVNKDRQTIRQLNDVQVNVSKYRNAINAQPGDIQHIDAMHRILAGVSEADTEKAAFLTLGAAMNMMEQSEVKNAWQKLTKPERDLVIGYLRSKGSIVAYNRVVSGSGRSNKESLTIEMANLPTPDVGATVGTDQLNSFQENIDVVSKGFPTNLPGVPSPAQTRHEIEGVALRYDPNTQQVVPVRKGGMK